MHVYKWIQHHVPILCNRLSLQLSFPNTLELSVSVQIILNLVTFANLFNCNMKCILAWHRNRNQNVYLECMTIRTMKPRMRFDSQFVVQNIAQRIKYVRIVSLKKVRGSQLVESAWQVGCTAAAEAYAKEKPGSGPAQGGVGMVSCTKTKHSWWYARA